MDEMPMSELLLWVTIFLLMACILAPLIIVRIVEGRWPSWLAYLWRRPNDFFTGPQARREFEFVNRSSLSLAMELAGADGNAAPIPKSKAVKKPRKPAKPRAKAKGNSPSASSKGRARG